MSNWRISGRTIEFGPPLAAGIVNVTDDSFYAGARSGTPEGAIADGLRLAAAGFDLLDVGAVAARSGNGKMHGFSSVAAWVAAVFGASYAGALNAGRLPAS